LPALALTMLQASTVPVAEGCSNSIGRGGQLVARLGQQSDPPQSATSGPVDQQREASPTE
jgi:hypothetical protein